MQGPPPSRPIDPHPKGSRAKIGMGARAAVDESTAVAGGAWVAANDAGVSAFFRCRHDGYNCGPTAFLAGREACAVIGETAC